MSDNLAAFRLALSCARHRRLIRISGARDDVRERASALLAGLEYDDVLWVGGPQQITLEQRVERLAMKKARNRLGGEQGAVVFDAFEGFDPDAFGALSGTVRAGGVLLLLVPDDWGDAADGDYARLADHPWHWAQLASRYLARLARRLDTPGVTHWRQGEALPSLPVSSPAESVRPQSGDDGCLSVDQARAVREIAGLKRRRPLVLTADRGRGKSAALGIGAAQRLIAGDDEIMLTAPSMQSVAPLFERLAALLPEGERQGGQFVWRGRAVRFIAPDRLDADAERPGGAGRVLLVDEAAALPAALLERALRHFPRVAFATTVHGYEGSGRGFALRFRERLARITPQWRALELHTPVRWAPHDPLEQATDDLLMLSAEPPPLSEPPERVYQHCLDRSALAVDESRLAALFGLLVQAHYRTAPADLRALLDGPGITLETLESAPRPGAGALLAVALTVEEGGFDAELAERVAAGERRPRGHLVAQSLALHAGVAAAATHRQRRIMRLAVHPQARRQGLGSRLVAQLAETTAAEGYDLLTASFGAEAGLIAFWRRCGLVSLRPGVRHETSTGEYPLMMGRALSPAGDVLLAELRAHHAESLPQLLAFELHAMTSEVATMLLAELPVAPLDADRRLRLTRFAHASAPLVACRAALRRLVCLELARRGTTAETLEALAPWVALLWQGRDEAWLVRRLAVAGRAPLYLRFRREVAEWLAHAGREEMG
nr:GNAT family N-acetyltransferase [Kushneria aurantia]